MSLTRHPSKKTTIGQVANFMIAYLDVSDEVVFEFEGLTLKATPGDTQADIVRQYQRAKKKLRRRDKSRKRSKGARSA